ncbi:DinB family protein [Terribacillus saccharophilus]|uniref:DinB family protein n=1 Tax=Terribacillus saccharophilus TaxID=361277 RepID=UPI000C99B98D|nr:MULTISPECIES: DinB family protein [Terribacillus]MEC0282723.1 DinB family protein [Terribacillus saccharophilus]MEC0291924.1 DinB family protein [Terribacillus saccharophilus]
MEEVVFIFTYRNDVRKILIPYLKKLTPQQWEANTYHNTISWVIEHMAQTEDYWVFQIGLGEESRIIEENQNPLEQYLRIREKTDQVLHSLEAKDLNRLVVVPDFSDGWKPPSEPTMRWLFHHVYSHEVYHAGQIGVIARLNGFDGPLF